eukprot:9494116-Alexandrium_andersonii.AAC.1
MAGRSCRHSWGAPARVLTPSGPSLSWCALANATWKRLTWAPVAASRALGSRAPRTLGRRLPRSEG